MSVMYLYYEYATWLAPGPQDIVNEGKEDISLSSRRLDPTYPRIVVLLSDTTYPKSLTPSARWACLGDSISRSARDDPARSTDIHQSSVDGQLQGNIDFSVRYAGR